MRFEHLSLRRVLLPIVGAGLLAIAGCSSSGDSGPSPQPTAGGSALTVSVHSSDKGDVLSNPSGRTLYFNDQEHGNVLCKSSACTAIWLPVTVSAGQTPTGPSEVSGALSTLKRPDGSSQVALDGKPLYTFSFDHSAGDTGGDGFPDTFDGTDFTWHAATANGSVASTAPSAPSTPSYNYDY